MHLVDADKNKREHNLTLLGEAGALRPCSSCLWAKGTGEVAWERHCAQGESYAAVLGRRRRGLSCVLDIFGWGVLPAELSSGLHCCKDLLHLSCRTSHLSLSNFMRFLLVPSCSRSGLSEGQFCPGTCQSLSFGGFGVGCRLDEGSHCLHFTPLTKILNCQNRSLRNSTFKSLQVEYEPLSSKNKAVCHPPTNPPVQTRMFQPRYKGARGNHA